LNELDFKAVRIDKVDIPAMGFIGAIFGNGKARVGQTTDNGIKVVGDKGEVRQTHLVTGQIPVFTFTMIAENQVLVVIAKMHPGAGFTVPLALALIPKAPMGECGPIKLQGFSDICNDQVDMF
jgi:hypothetical protein